MIAEAAIGSRPQKIPQWVPQQVLQQVLQWGATGFYSGVLQGSAVGVQGSAVGAAESIAVGLSGWE